MGILTIYGINENGEYTYAMQRLLKKRTGGGIIIITIIILKMTATRQRIAFGEDENASLLENIVAPN